MANIFNNPYSGTAEVWSLQGASILVDDIKAGDSGNVSILGAVDNIQVTFGRATNTRYPIATDSKPIKLIGPPRGTITIQTIFGPRVAIENFLSKFGSNCKTFKLTIKFSKSSRQFEDCDTQDAGNHSMVCEGCLGQKLSYTLNSQENIVIATGSFVIEFDKLTMDVN